MPSIVVRCDGRSFLVPGITFENWLPALVPLIFWRSYFDGDIFARQLYFRLDGRPSVPIRLHHIHDALRNFFDELSGFDSSHSGFQGARIRDMLDKFLRDERSGRDFGSLKGLYRSRNRFLILCLVANSSHSVLLARALGEFIEDKASRIVEKEEERLLPEWALGVETLRGLLSEWEFQGLMDRLSDVGSGWVGNWDIVPQYPLFPRRLHRRRVYEPFPEPYGWPRVHFPVPRRRHSYDSMRAVHPYVPAHLRMFSPISAPDWGLPVAGWSPPSPPARRAITQDTDEKKMDRINKAIENADWEAHVNKVFNSTEPKKHPFADD